jgi:hypothetical protein
MPQATFLNAELLTLFHLSAWGPKLSFSRSTSFDCASLKASHASQFSVGLLRAFGFARMLLIGCPGSALNRSMLARSFPVLERESDKLADPETGTRS